ncbi:MAG: hypothetical protein V3U35_07965 [Candidatus Neomarinimicrobiota bacterium]
MQQNSAGIVQSPPNQLYPLTVWASSQQLAPRYGPTKPGEQRRSVISPAFAREALGWEPQVTLADGLTRTYSSFT